MNGLDFLNLVIGLIFIYLIYSIAASTIWEIFISLIHLRGKMLVNWLKSNFPEGTFGEAIEKHELIKALSRGKDKAPSYVPSEVFVDALIDVINKNKNGNQFAPLDINELKNAISNSNLIETGIGRSILQYIDESAGKLQYVKEKIRRWYDEAQESLIGSFKKKLQRWILLISSLLVVFTNADTIEIADYLYKNDDAREAIAKKADLFVKDTSIINTISAIDASQLDSLARLQQAELVERIDANVADLKLLQAELKQTRLPIGWGEANVGELDFIGWLKKIGGLLLTAFAVSVGSPFWFEVLGRLANLRSTGNKPKSSLDPDDGKTP